MTVRTSEDPMRQDPMSEDRRVGLVVVHRRYVPYSHAHYAGNLVDGAYSLAAFGTQAVPEPMTLGLIGIALAGLGFSSRRKQS